MLFFIFNSFKKELIEITHASSYEQPCQYTMDDIEVNADDLNISYNMILAYRYEKDPVPFEGMQSLMDCPYLGGK